MTLSFQLGIVTEKLTLAQSYVNTIRNGQSAVSTLPPEILNLVFSMTAPTPSEFSPTVPPLVYQDGVGSESAWWSNSWHSVRLTGVCRYWKAVTLLFPSIWTTVSLGPERQYPNANGELAQLCLRRSYGASIDVYIWAWPSEDLMPWVTETLASQSIRFRSLHIYNFDFDAEFLHQFEECPTPQLESLTIAPPKNNPSPLPTIFAGYTPKLRHLTLHRLTSWWGNDFKNLTSLCLKDAAQSLTYDEFFDLIASSPDLEHMELVEAGPISETYDVPDTYHVALPRLRTLCIESSSSTRLIRILSHLQPSTTLSLRIRQRCSDARPGSILAVTSRLEGVRNVSKLRLRTERVSFNHKRLQLTGAGESSFDLPFSADFHEMASNQYMAAAIGLFTACNITELWIGTDDVVVREELWQRLLYALPSLTKLVLGPWEQVSHGLLSALYSRDESMGLALPCPSLRELVVLGRLERPGIVGSIYNLLLQRKMRNFPISRVILKRLEGTPAAPSLGLEFWDGLTRLQEVVQDVHHEVVQRFPEMTPY